MSGSLHESSALIEKPEDLTPKKKRKQSVAEELNDCKKSRNDTVNTISLNEVINLRFPHIGEQIFETFDTAELTKCLKVSRTWFVLAGNVLIKRQEGEFCKKLLEVWKRDKYGNAIQRFIQNYPHGGLRLFRWFEANKQKLRKEKLLEAAMIRRRMTHMYARRQIMMDALN